MHGRERKNPLRLTFEVREGVTMDECQDGERTGEKNLKSNNVA